MSRPRKRVHRADVSDLPACTLGEAARWLGLSPSTVRAWSLDQRARDGGERKPLRAVIAAADAGEKLLSFTNLVELHVLSAIRRQHGVRVQGLRKLVGFLGRRLGAERALATQRMLTEGRELLVRHGPQLLGVSRGGPVELGIVDAYLRRVEFDPEGRASRLFPFTRPLADARLDEQPRAIVLDPRIQGGRPCLASTGIPTAILSERFRAGDPPRDLAQDYARRDEEIWEALRFECGVAA